MEAAIRTVKETLENKPLESLDFTVVRGMEGVKTAELEVAGMKVKVAVASSMSCAKPLLDEIRAGTSPYHFIEIMGCPGGCINGGGQPIISATIRNGFKPIDWKKERAKALYDEDAMQSVRKSHENPQIIALYEEFLKEPGSHLAHELLHTTYSKKERFK